MRYSFKKINIEAPFPTTQCGHSCQTFLVSEFKDHLYARVLGIDDGNNWIIHFSMDLLAFDTEHRNQLEEALRKHYSDDRIKVITSTTHTHYANSVRDPKYVDYLMETLINGIKDMKYITKNNVSTTYQRFHTNAVGKSRISGYETNNEYLCLIRFFEDDTNFLNIIYNNCHPTILSAMSNFFSSEYPGQVLRRLEDDFKDVDFTFLMGAAGDISSRFVREGQTYEDVIKLGDKLYKEVLALIKQDLPKVPLSISYKTKTINIKHEFTPIDLSNIRTDLTDRELETIRLGQIEREKLQKKANEIFGTLAQTMTITKLSLGSVELIFFPNEIFSEYMNYINLDKQILVSYSNGYGPYVLPVDFKYITYEMFTDTITKETKLEFIETFKTI